jgi:hypothetical protein
VPVTWLTDGAAETAAGAVAETARAAATASKAVLMVAVKGLTPTSLWVIRRLPWPAERDVDLAVAAEDGLGDVIVSRSRLHVQVS